MKSSETGRRAAPDQIGQEDEGSLEHGHHVQVVWGSRADLRGELGDALLESAHESRIQSGAGRPSSAHDHTHNEDVRDHHREPTRACCRRRTVTLAAAATSRRWRRTRSRAPDDGRADDARRRTTAALAPARTSGASRSQRPHRRRAAAALVTCLRGRGLAVARSRHRRAATRSIIRTTAAAVGRAVVRARSRRRHRHRRGRASGRRSRPTRSTAFAPRCAINETLARYARQHNGANVLALGATLLTADEARPIVATLADDADDRAALHRAAGEDPRSWSRREWTRY